jgi:palmitoyltransferase
MAYTSIGCLFIIIFGVEIGLNAIFWSDGGGWNELEALQGQPVRFNLSGHIIPVTEMNDYEEMGIAPAEHDLPIPSDHTFSSAKHRSIIFMAFTCVSTVLALGTLTLWHSRLIGAGQTSIEAHINESETKRLKKLGKTYSNPYNFGKRKNWLLFLGLVRTRSWWRHVFLPSGHSPEGTGLTWYTVQDIAAVPPQVNDWP